MWVGQNPRYSGRETLFPWSLPMLLCSMHAKVQHAGTPRYCSLYNAQFLPNVFYYLRVTFAFLLVVEHA
jgi:hypothetical protein